MDKRQANSWAERYQNLMGELAFQELGYYKKDLEKGQFVSFGTIDGQKLILKATPLDDQVKIAGFTKEALVCEILQSHNSKSGRGIGTVAVVAHGQNKHFFWLTRQYCEGDTLATPQKDQYLYGFDQLNPKFEKKCSLLIPEILTNLEAFNSVSSAEVKAKLPPESRKCKYLKDVENYDLESIEKGLSRSLGNCLAFYNSVKKEYWEESNIVSCVGDFVPANIIITPNHQEHPVLFSDYEWFCLDNKTSDLALFWLFLWRYPAWQKELLENVKAKKEKDFFVASVIRILIGWYSIIYAPNNKPAVKNEKAKEFYRKHRWTDYLSVEKISYQELTK